MSKLKSSGALVKWIFGFFAIIIILALISNTAWGKRWWKTQTSSWGDGIYREVTVYDAVGNILYTQTGKFDVDYSSGRVMYDDENGYRHVVYFEDGLVMVHEVPEPSDN